MSDEKESDSEDKKPKAPSRVWVVEDNTTLATTVARVLDRQKDMKCVHKFERCEEAIEALVAGERPDVMLFDIGLPGMSGIEGIRRIKTALPEIEILVFSVFDDNEKVFNAICAGASGYLLKTSSMGEIPDAIREILGGGAPINALIARRVLDMFSDLAPQSRDYGLTDREKEVLEQMVEGLTKKEIADQLDLSFHTVDKHIRGIYSKLHVNTMTGAVAKALKEGLLPKG
ncbi:MAG: response regulator transcription factor [Verrucomicrobiales bacterium]|nr:response regulator transcription factor [Verrucomicrobiales bacterium]